MRTGLTTAFRCSPLTELRLLMQLTSIRAEVEYCTTYGLNRFICFRQWATVLQWLPGPIPMLVKSDPGRQLQPIRWKFSLLSMGLTLCWKE